MKTNKFLLALSLAALLFPAVAFSTTYSIYDIRSNVNSSDMNGIEVTVDWGTSTSTHTWDDGVAGDGWSLSFSGLDTGSLNLGWQLTTDVAINSFTIDGLGNIFFDILYSSNNPATDTSGSSNGFWGPNFETSDATDATWGTYFHTDYNSQDTDDRRKYYSTERNHYADFYWEFTDPGFRTSDAAQDLFSKLLIDFGTSKGDITSFTGTFNFGADTDLAVPEPSAILLFGLGLIGMGAVSRIKR